jgi:hypothetical protein
MLLWLPPSFSDLIGQFDQKGIGISQIYLLSFKGVPTLSNNRGCSTSRKRQLSKASDEEMKPPASRPRSQSQTRKTDEWRNYFQDTRSVIQHDKSDRIYTDETKYSTQYNSRFEVGLGVLDLADILFVYNF